MDITQREGNYPGIPEGTSPILGVEFSGHITALGPNTSLRWQTGDEVLGLSSGVSSSRIRAAKTRY
jgi:NADPH:quinone reductase-like Zn-dependent oxidoreductase